MMAAVMAQISTAPALISLTSRILSSHSGCTASDNLSIAELIASPANTRPIAKTTASHSTFDSLNRNPANTTTIVIPQWIQALCSWRTNRVSPLQAFVKLARRALMEKLCFYSFWCLNCLKYSKIKRRTMCRWKRKTCSVPEMMCSSQFRYRASYSLLHVSGTILSQVPCIRQTGPVNQDDSSSIGRFCAERMYSLPILKP